jgi:hypothetical protein
MQLALQAAGSKERIVTRQANISAPKTQPAMYLCIQQAAFSAAKKSRLNQFVLLI